MDVIELLNMQREIIVNILSHPSINLDHKFDELEEVADQIKLVVTRDILNMPETWGL